MKSSRCDLNYKEKKLSKYCPDACGFCDEEKPDDDKPDDDKPDDDKPDDDECADDPDFRFNNKNNKDCDWVDINPKSRCDLTWKGTKVSDYCPVTCWACDWDWDK